MDPQRLHRGEGEERQERQLHPVQPLELRLGPVAQPGDAGHVDLDDRGELSRGLQQLCCQMRARINQVLAIVEDEQQLFIAQVVRQRRQDRLAGQFAHVDTELLLVTGPLTVISLQMVVSFLTQRIPALRAIALGTLITALAWIILIVHPTVPMAVLTLFTVSLGQITQSPRYYEYISRLAPPGQQGTYMGFAFLPIGIGSLIGGWFGGSLIHHFGEVTHQPERIWWAVTAVGVATAALLWIYDRKVQPTTATAPP